MPKYKCPSCKEETISLKEKYLTGMWMTTTCNSCGARVAALPLVLMLIWFCYVWNVIWWVGMSVFNGSWHYMIYMVVGWLILDFLNVNLIPLASLRAKQTPKTE